MRPGRSLEAVEFATLTWTDWFNNRRLLECIGYVPPAERERAYHREQAAILKSDFPGGLPSPPRPPCSMQQQQCRDPTNSASGERGAVQFRSPTLPDTAMMSVDSVEGRLLDVGTMPRLLAAAAGRARPFITLAMNTGIAKGDLLGLNRRDVDTRTRSLGA